VDAARSVAEVVARVTAIQSDGLFVIGIDGFMAAGKSTLAKHLNANLGWRRFELDDYLEPGGDPRSYLASLRMAELRAAWTAHRAETAPLIVAGACLREVLSSLEDEAGAHIYSKCLNAIGERWDEGDALWSFANGKASAQDIPPLSRSILEYHAKWKPHESADIVFEWLDSGWS
jgi:hypothetical protein